MYPDVLAASESLGRKLYSFAGHSIDATHTSYCFNILARAVGHIAKNKAERAISFEAGIFVCGEELPVFVTIRGNDMFKPVEVIISREVPEFD